MPSITEEHPRALLSTRKRRRDDDGIQSTHNNATNTYQTPTRDKQRQPQIYGFSYDHDLCPQEPEDFHFPIITYETVPDHTKEHVNRKIIPLPSAKRQRFHDEHDTENRPPTYHDQHGLKSRRHSRSPSHTNSPRSTQPTRANTGTRLDPCHICLRKPTKKSELDSFAECQGCGARTCFVCLRECQGWIRDAPKSEDSDGDVDIAEQEALSRSFHMTDADHEQDTARKTGRNVHGSAGWATGEHRAVVCSQCCIEKGAEGDIVCLGCLSRTREM